MRRCAVAIVALLTFLFTAGSEPTFTAGATPTLTPGPRPWPTDHGDNRRSGFYPSGTLFRHLTKAWGRGLDGAVYGSPIAVGGFVFVATENNPARSRGRSAGDAIFGHRLRHRVWRV